jgi:hypothetical protein
MNKREQRALVTYFQRNYEPGTLKVDGVLGPKTTATLNRYADTLEPMGLMSIAWKAALADVGCGGAPNRNNDSFYIFNMRRDCGFPTQAKGPWCGVFASHKLKVSGIPVQVSRGAYRLCANLVDAPGGGHEVEPADMAVGQVYLACWRRARWASHREAHVRFVRKLRSGAYEYIGGNEKGDKVVSDRLTGSEFERKLIMVAGYNG